MFELFEVEIICRNLNIVLEGEVICDVLVYY